MKLELPLLLEQPVLSPAQKALLVRQQAAPRAPSPWVRPWYRDRHFPAAVLHSEPPPRRSLVQRVLRRLLPRAA